MAFQFLQIIFSRFSHSVKVRIHSLTRFEELRPHGNLPAVQSANERDRARALSLLMQRDKAMTETSIIIHGGAGEDNDFIHKHIDDYQMSLKRICESGYNKLKHRTTAIETVYHVLGMLEDDPLFNAGRGSTLNEHGVVQMDASVMDGKNLRTGAVALLEHVKNPSQLLKEILQDTNHSILGAQGALDFAIRKKIELEPESYFITEHQVDVFMKLRDKESLQQRLRKKHHSTTGVVAYDKWGNVAAGTSSGGTENCLSGRIGDSSVIGCGCYADNKIGAFSVSGDGEYIIQRVIAHTVAMYLEFTKCTIQEACDYVVHERNKSIDGHIGVIATDNQGNLGISFNSPRFHRAWIGKDGRLSVSLYK
jgi:beta-aspartyl-peptidase (threonine type)